MSTYPYATHCVPEDAAMRAGRPLTADTSAWCRECLHTISACVQPAVLLQELEKGMADTHVPMRHCSGMPLSIGLFAP
jgi:hypothetical protein